MLPKTDQANKVGRLTVTDMHTAGEPVRIVTGGYPTLSGVSILEKRQDALQNHDNLRKTMMLEPRGHSEMYGAIPIPPSDPSADLAVLFTHGSGYSTMCGHATIALGRWALEAGLIAQIEPVTEFILECPCGPVHVATAVEDGVIGDTSFESVTGYVHILDMEIVLPSIGRITVDIAYGGAYYAFVSAADLKLDFTRSSKDEIKARAVELVSIIRQTYKIEHPQSTDLGFLYGAIITETNDVRLNDTNRHLCYFAEGQLDRSPTGSGVTARLALAYAKGHVDLGDVCFFSGASGLNFSGTISNESQLADRNGVTTQVSGRAYHCGTSSYVIEEDDPLRDGWQL